MPRQPGLACERRTPGPPAASCCDTRTASPRTSQQTQATPRTRHSRVSNDAFTRDSPPRSPRKRSQRGRRVHSQAALFAAFPVERDDACHNNLAMSTSDWAATAAAVISLVALLFSLRNRSADIAREEAYRVRARVWEILSGEPGLRTILALDEGDENSEKRVKLLGRTCAQLEVAGAAMLGSKLRDLLEQGWGSKTTPRSLSIRIDFIESASEFMKPARSDRPRVKLLGG